MNDAIIRIAVHVLHDENLYGYTVDYINGSFLVAASAIISVIERQMVLVELPVHVIRRTGRASWLVEYRGHEMPVHEQQIRMAVSA